MQGVNLKESDFVEHLFIASTHDYILFFSNKGKVYRLKVYEIPEASRHATHTLRIATHRAYFFFIPLNRLTSR